MPIIHSTATPNLPKPDMHTGVMLPIFLFRFWTKTECPEKKEAIATSAEQAKELLGSNVVFSAQFPYEA
ncbi:MULTISPECIES: hypothetical protein [Proteus]|uniref:hypothetical protein n=1 Tax=Proteus TaxID=583 RepID=UPI000952EC38|nr:MULTISPECIES: hypothetical protein [Proteus]MBI6327085.1 hypothetical protein [Proteus mirabilis]MBI6454545.1 hypothetical protein [Proteus mirabilis]NGX90977.1 hypothetical protein [Proteus mirabilis]WCG89587.1 hypothetical protein ONR67_14280 [Proteus terrae]HCU0052516.1 hypothetical protein [Proteus mirabilis]